MSEMTTNKYYYVEKKLYERKEITPKECDSHRFIERRIFDNVRPHANTRTIVACTSCRAVNDDNEDLTRWIS